MSGSRYHSNNIYDGPATGDRVIILSFTVCNIDPIGKIESPEMWAHHIYKHYLPKDQLKVCFKAKIKKMPCVEIGNVIYLVKFLHSKVWLVTHHVALLLIQLPLHSKCLNYTYVIGELTGPRS